MEWGCMQALIDFDGWRKWKDFSLVNEEKERASEMEREKEKHQRRKSTRLSLHSNLPVTNMK